MPGRGKPKSDVVSNSAELGGGDNKASQSLDNQTMDNLNERLKYLNFDNATNDYMNKLGVSFANMNNSSNEEVESLICQMFSLMEEDWLRAEKISLICRSIIITKSAFASNFETLILTKLENQIKDISRKRGTPNALASAAFLCQYYVNVPMMINLERTNILIQPILETLKMLTDWNTTDDEMQVAARQIMFIGPLLEGDKQLSDITRIIENKIIDAAGSEECRKKLMHVVKAKASNWTMVDEILKTWNTV